MNYTALAEEVNVDPLGRGYADMTDQEVVDSLTTADRPRDRKSMSGSEVFNAIDPAEWNDLTVDGQQLIWNVLHLGNVNPFGMEQKVFVGVFGGESTTIHNLSEVRVETISRAAEQRLGDVKAGYVQKVRT